MLHARLLFPAAAGLFVAAAACGSSDTYSAPPPDFSGAFNVSVTNATNGCNYGNWTNGQSTQNVGFTITQSGNSVTGSITNPVIDAYFKLLGITAFAGSVSGDKAELSATGTTSLKDMTTSCAYYVKTTIDITLTGDTINGTLTYSDVVNDPNACGALTTCTSVQNVSGSRPPKVGDAGH